MTKKTFFQAFISRHVLAFMLSITSVGMTTEVMAQAAPTVGASTMVRMQTSLGAIDIRLYDSAAPLTVANFLSYVESGAYSNSLMHRSVKNFILQGGAYDLKEGSSSLTAITTRSPVMNEFSSSRSNIRGTVAMAKVSGDPNSATSQWFFNLADNSANLDAQNGGFTVFGQVVEKSMSVVDAIGALPIAGDVFKTIANCQSPISSLPDLPLALTPVTCSVQKPNLVMITSVSSSRSSNNVSDSDRVFAYLEGAYPEHLSPASPLYSAGVVSSTSGDYYYRYYSTTKAYIATSNGIVYYMGPASQNQILSLGALSGWFSAAVIAGY